MNETHRAVAPVHGVRVYCTGYGAVPHFLCPLVCVLWLWRCEGSTQKLCCLRHSVLRSGAPGRTVGEVEDV